MNEHSTQVHRLCTTYPVSTIRRGIASIYRLVVVCVSTWHNCVYCGEMVRVNVCP